MSAWVRMNAMMHAANAMGLQYLAVRALGVLAARVAGHATRRRTAAAKRSMSSMSL